jgi:uncharacterized protein
MSRPFLTARWQNLILANYPVPESLLRSKLPPGLEPDSRAGQCWCSLVGFQFLDTRVFGIPWPGYRNFTEWNLRCYVRHGSQRGVLFIREYVQSRFIAWVARTIYNEPYSRAEIAETVKEELQQVHVEYRLNVGGRWHFLRAAGDSPAAPVPESLEHWFTDQSWGFGCTKAGNLAKYQVRHPLWNVYRVREPFIDVDWEALYGPEWAELQGVPPSSVVFAVGSSVEVFPNRLIAG